MFSDKKVIQILAIPSNLIIKFKTHGNNGHTPQAGHLLALMEDGDVRILYFDSLGVPCDARSDINISSFQIIRD